MSLRMTRWGADLTLAATLTSHPRICSSSRPCRGRILLLSYPLRESLVLRNLLLSGRRRKRRFLNRWMEVHLSRPPRIRQTSSVVRMRLPPCWHLVPSTRPWILSNLKASSRSQYLIQGRTSALLTRPNRRTAGIVSSLGSSRCLTAFLTDSLNLQKLISRLPLLRSRRKTLILTRMTKKL